MGWPIISRLCKLVATLAMVVVGLIPAIILISFIVIILSILVGSLGLVALLAGSYWL
ncbi:MAG: hypothetical protein LM584_00235 [Desulfurococcaceae archaeon]|nr:hypothetical protein [Desulfurococcaceae archaeon]